MLEPPLPYLSGPPEISRRIKEARSALRLSLTGVAAFVVVVALTSFAAFAITDHQTPFYYWSDRWNFDSRAVFFFLIVGGLVCALLGFVSGISKRAVPQGRLALVIGGVVTFFMVFLYWRWDGIL